MSLLDSFRTSVEFGSPLYLWFVPLAAACFTLGLIVHGLMRRRRPARTYGSSYPRIGRVKLWLGAALILAVTAVAAAQPRFVSGGPTFKRGSVDVVIAVDVSSSMWVKDLGPSRLEVALREVLNLESQGILQTGDRAGLFVFGGTTIRKAHVSTNVRRLMELASQLTAPPTLTGDSLPWDSDVAGALEQVVYSLDAQDRIEAGLSEREWMPARRADRIVVLISDGDFAVDDGRRERLEAALAEFRRRGLPVYGVGIGSKAGTDLTAILRDYEPERDYDATLVSELEGQRTRLTMATLSLLAERTGGGAFMIDSPGSSAVAFFREAVQSRRSISLQLIPNHQMHEAWRYFLVAGVLLFALAVLFY
jgi:hypothetical protein